MEESYSIELGDRFSAAIREGNIESAESILRTCPSLIGTEHRGNTWLHIAAHRDVEGMIRWLVEKGCDVNAVRDRDTPISNAIARDNPRIVRVLLELGADPNYERKVISAISGAKKNSLEMLKLLEQYGADIHREFVNEYTNQPMNALSTAIAFGKEDVITYLHSRGAALPGTISQNASPEVSADEIISYFTEHFGAPRESKLIEIVPTEPSIVIHIIPKTSDRPYVTLFTTGFSSVAMNVPLGQEDFRYAELFIQLPGDWPFEQLADPRWGWPVHWLRSMAQYPRQNDSWLGGVVSLVANGDPPQPLATNTKMTTVLLFAERSFVAKDGRKIQLYRMTPLYTEERDLEIREGLAALMQEFDSASMPFIVDINRPNVALLK